MNKFSDWSDFPIRLASGLFLLTISSLCIFYGNLSFSLFLIFLVGIMHWELGKMLSPLTTQTSWFSFLMSVVVFCSLINVENYFWKSLILIFNFFFQKSFFNQFTNFGIFYSLAIIVCGLVFYELRQELGVIYIVWLVGIVIFTDIAGYVAGRLIGGPKIMPRVSPKKTWSGVLGGWIAAGLFAMLFFDYLNPQSLMITFVFCSVILSIASQIGDMTQSHLKRLCEVKDSSNLIPGHGGFMDRFDGFIGAAVVLAVIFVWIYR